MTLIAEYVLCSARCKQIYCPVNVVPNMIRSDVLSFRQQLPTNNHKTTNTLLVFFRAPRKRVDFGCTSEICSYTSAPNRLR